MYSKQFFTIGNTGLGPNLYGVMIVVGLICCFIFLAILGKRLGMSKASLDFYEMNAIASIAIGFLFATIFQYVYDLIAFGSARFGNMTFLGGLIGGVLTFTVVTVFFAKPEYKKDIYKLLEVAMPCILITHAFGRIGCFFAGCCYGIHTEGPLGMDFPSIGVVLPTQLFEAIFLFIMCAVALSLINKKLSYNVPLYMLSYSVFRFTLEFFRGDNRGGFIPGLSPTQFWCILMFLGGAALLTSMLLYKFKKDKLPKVLAKIAEGFDNVYKNKESNLKTQKTQENPA